MKDEKKMKELKKAGISDYPENFRESCRLLEEAIGYHFQNPVYLYIALTHSSYANENASRVFYECNERQEFLGDSVLAIAVSQQLFLHLENNPEGDLTKARAKIVCEDACYEYAKSIDLGSFMLLGRGEESMGGRGRKSILADAFEALIAAVYLDGGMEPAEGFVLRSSWEMIKRAERGELSKDYKSLLQQIVQNSKGDLLEYETVCEKGPDHDKIFVIRVLLNSQEIGRGEGRTKREAEQNAASVALKLFGEV